MMDFRQWLHDRLIGAPDVNNGAPGGIHSTVEETPSDKPFIVHRLSPTDLSVVDGVIQNCTIWIHDEPSTYDRIDDLLNKIRDALEGPMNVDGGILCEWTGNSPDLADDARGTVVRWATFRLAGRR